MIPVYSGFGLDWSIRIERMDRCRKIDDYIFAQNLLGNINILAYQYTYLPILIFIFMLQQLLFYLSLAMQRYMHISILILLNCFTYLFTYSGVQHTLCCVFVLFIFVLPVSLDCLFLNVPSVFSKVYLQ